MRKIIVSEWISLDGVFDAETMGEWFFPFDSIARQEHIRQGILAADAFLLGRKTYEMLASYWPSQQNNEMGVAAKLNSAPKFVVSNNLDKAGWNNTTIIQGNVLEEIASLKLQAGNEIQVEGSATLVESLVKADLVDEYQFLVHPVIPGKGKRFFKEGMNIGKLELVETKKMDHGVVLLNYKRP